VPKHLPAAFYSHRMRISLQVNNLAEGRDGFTGPGKAEKASRLVFALIPTGTMAWSHVSTFVNTARPSQAQTAHDPATACAGGCSAGAFRSQRNTNKPSGMENK